MIQSVFCYFHLSGIRIVALILSTTGISLLAYMENNHDILVSVVLGTASAVGTAVYKVMFKKVMGEVNFLEVSIFFSVRYRYFDSDFSAIGKNLLVKSIL